jgi:hypothetical protein
VPSLSILSWAQTRWLLFSHELAQPMASKMKPARPVVGPKFEDLETFEEEEILVRKELAKGPNKVAAFRYRLALVRRLVDGCLNGTPEEELDQYRNGMNHCSMYLRDKTSYEGFCNGLGVKPATDF